jgi:hypothetical protein
MHSKIVYQLIVEEIRRVVADAIERKECLAVGRRASLIQRAYPNSGLSSDEICNEILAAAISARVPVEMSKPEAEQRV